MINSDSDVKNEKRRATSFVTDVATLAFLFITIALSTLFLIRFGFALLSTNRLENCILKSDLRGYVLVQESRWGIIPRELVSKDIHEMLTAAQLICPDI
jgi:hypothetical protein